MDGPAAAVAGGPTPEQPRFPVPKVLPTTVVQLAHHIFVGSVVVGTPFLAPWALPSLPLVLFMFLYSDAYSAALHATLDRRESLDIGFLRGAAEGFQMHHDHPKESTRDQGLYRLMCDTVRIQWITGTCGLLTSTRSPVALSVIILKWVCCAYGSQLGHYWAHTPRTKCPAVVQALQDAHILLPAKEHSSHHTPPSDKDFAIVSGLSNGLMNWVLKDMAFKPLLALFIFMTVFDVALVERLFTSFA